MPGGGRGSPFSPARGGAEGPRSPALLRNSPAASQQRTPQEMILVLFALTVHLAPRRWFFALISRNPRLRGPDFTLAAERESAGSRASPASPLQQVARASGDWLGRPLPCLTYKARGAVARHFAPRKRARAQWEPASRDGAGALASERARGVRTGAAAAPPQSFPGSHPRFPGKGLIVNS